VSGGFATLLRLMMDIDYFKIVNDSMALVGSQTLEEMGDA